MMWGQETVHPSWYKLLQQVSFQTFEIIHVLMFTSTVYTHTVSTLPFPLSDHHTVRKDSGNVTMWNYTFPIEVSLNAPTCICTTVDYLFYYVVMGSELHVRMAFGKAMTTLINVYIGSYTPILGGHCPSQQYTKIMGK